MHARATHGRGTHGQIAPTGSGTVTLSLHDLAANTWTPDVTAAYDRTGTVVRLTGAVTGLLSFVPRRRRIWPDRVTRRVLGRTAQ